MKFDIDPDIVPNLKLGLHSFQIIFTVVAWCMEIAVFRGEDAEITGRNGWTFAVMFLSLPAWIFLIMTPRFNRTRKIAEPHAMLGVDALMTLLWLTAFATQASYNSAGLCGKVCGVSKAIVALGVFITLLFIATSFISGFTLHHFKFHGTLPGYDNRKIKSGENIDPDKAAFSMAPHDEEAYERVNMEDQEASGGNGGNGGGYGNFDNNNNHGSNYNDTDPYGEGNPYSHNDDLHSHGGNPPNTGHYFDSETEYRPGGHSPSSTPYANPPVGDRYDDHPAQFPVANYDRNH